MVETKSDMLFLPESGKLDGKNYPIWKFKLKNILKMKDLWDITLGKEGRPEVRKRMYAEKETSQQRDIEDERYEAELNAREQFDKRAQRALVYINMNVKDNIIPQISGAQWPDEAWTTLSSLFESVNTTRLLFLK